MHQSKKLWKWIQQQWKFLSWWFTQKYWRIQPSLLNTITCPLTCHCWKRQRKHNVYEAEVTDCLVWEETRIVMMQFLNKRILYRYRVKKQPPGNWRSTYIIEKRVTSTMLLSAHLYIKGPKPFNIFWSFAFWTFHTPPPPPFVAYYVVTTYPTFQQYFGAP